MQVHSFTDLMCWAGIERFSRIKKTADLQSTLKTAELELRHSIKDGSLRNGPTDSSFDASLALLPLLRFPDQEISRKTVEQIIEKLGVPSAPGFFYRYLRSDDFGRPQSAFVICSFWIAQSLARIGRSGEARAIMDQVMRAANSLGLLSEHFDPASGTQLGNFPQTYSHVGLINTAFTVSPPWHEVL
jgi:GH15 family glucan-1,4-alpha-glucosidase